MHYAPEMSHRGRVVELWATLKFLGKDGVEELIDHLCNHAEEFANQLQTEGFRVLNDVVFNQVLVACDKAELTNEDVGKYPKIGRVLVCRRNLEWGACHSHQCLFVGYYRGGGEAFGSRLRQSPGYGWYSH
jgi:hypothetical protein